MKIKLYDTYNYLYLNEMSSQEYEQVVNDPLEIILKNDNVFSFQPKLLSYLEKNKLQEIIDKLLKERVIRPRNSEFSSPIVLIKKKKKREN